MKPQPFSIYCEKFALRGVPLPGVLDASQDSNAQEHYGPDRNPMRWYVHQVCAPNQPAEHNHESNGIERE